MVWTSIIPPLIASIVESVEAITIVIVIGTTINWKTSLLGAGAAIISLITLVAIISNSIVLIPITILRLVISITLIIFGLRWLKKAVLRYSGLIDRHNEAAIYKKKIIDIQTEGISIPCNFNNFGFLTSFKSVLFKGLEVAFIVITVGASSINGKQISIWPAGIGAILAFVIILILGLLIRTPLIKVPENTLKYIVSIVLVSFGTFWTGQQLGVKWVSSNFSLVILITFFLIFSFITIQWLKTYSSKNSGLKQSLEGK